MSRQGPQLNHYYQFASAHLDITPTQPCQLSGFVARTQDWDGVESPLEANAILLADGDSRVLFVSGDLLYFGGELTALLEQHAARYGIGRENLVLTASHTHFAPATDRSKPKLGAFDEAYNALLCERLVSLVDAVMSAERKPVSLRLKRTSVDLNVGRRRQWHLPTLSRIGLSLPPNIVMASEPKSTRDNFIDVLQFVDEGGRPVCAAWKFACHPVVYPSQLEISAEFVGAVRRRLREQFDPDMAVVFWQGFAGDVAANIAAKPTLRDLTVMVRIGPYIAASNLAQWRQWCDAIGREVSAAFSSTDGRVLSGPLHVSQRELPMSLILDDIANPQFQEKFLRIQCVRFGDDASALFLGAEVCSPYLDRLAADGKTICVGYTGDVFGYLPSDAQIEEGGYESALYLNYFDIKGRLKQGYEAKVTEAALELLKRSLGRVTGTTD